ncbi:MAG: YjcZ family sporulation protein [Acholeplasmataceae bacterium]|nr:YjcZ family sporulation protein [Acholeplasmataceae bacterium]HOA63248.1 YjcZ family sporulation protein [Bacilli bacterium]HPT88790.1 YjcZ family sporulation protein [Bacilli bacterium]HQA19323.1 YjcZ family sporulation protein [Bacilli bacterium]HQD91945.1 YjcZ family sporulation protein [Bacilli bacterium]
MSTQDTSCKTQVVYTHGTDRYAFILVLFILLVICGAAFWYC